MNLLTLKYNNFISQSQGMVVHVYEFDMKL
jgi:hypothetical protein